MILLTDLVSVEDECQVEASCRIYVMKEGTLDKKSITLFQFTSGIVFSLENKQTKSGVDDETE